MNRSTEILTTSNVEVTPSTSQAQIRRPTTQIVAIWDKQKTFTFLGLSLCFVLWACIYFPLAL